MVMVVAQNHSLGLLPVSIRDSKGHLVTDPGGSVPTPLHTRVFNSVSSGAVRGDSIWVFEVVRPLQVGDTVFADFNDTAFGTRSLAVIVFPGVSASLVAVSGPTSDNNGENNTFPTLTPTSLNVTVPAGDHIVIGYVGYDAASTFTQTNSWLELVDSGAGMLAWKQVSPGSPTGYNIAPTASAGANYWWSMVWAFAIKSGSRVKYVDPTSGNDSNAGHFGDPWATIAKLNSTLVAGETGAIRRDRIVTENVAFNPSGINNLTYTSYNPDTGDLYVTGDPKPTIRPSTNRCFEDNNVAKTNLAIKGLRFRPSGSQQIGLAQAAGSTGWLIEDCEFLDCGDYPLQANNTSSSQTGWVVRRCVFDGAQESALVLYGNTPTVEDCTFRRFGLSAGFGVHGIYTKGQSAIIRRNALSDFSTASSGITIRGTNTVVLQNDIRNATGGQSAIDSFWEENRTNTEGTTVIAHNRIYNCSVGLYIGPPNDSVVVPKNVSGAVNNGSGLVRLTVTGHGLSTGDKVFVLSVGGVSAANGYWTITNSGTNTVDLQGSTFAGTYTSGGTLQRVTRDSYAIFNNTIDGNGLSGGVSGQAMDFSDPWAAVSSIYWFNNVLMNMTSRYARWGTKSSTAGNTWDQDYNTYYPGTGNLYAHGASNGVSYATYIALAAVNESNTNQTNPAFAVGAPEFLPNASSATVDTGTATIPGVTFVPDTFQIDNYLGYKGSAPDKGAIEFEPLAVYLRDASPDENIPLLTATGNTYTKTGSGIAAGVGSGTYVREKVKTGSGVAPMTASGADVLTTSRTGAGVSAGVGSGAKVRERAKTGSGVAVMTASGADVLTAARTGAGVTSGVGSGTYTVDNIKTGNAIAPMVGSGADVFTATETGSGVSPHTASGADQLTAARTGAGVSAQIGSGTYVVENIKTGSGVAPMVASGDGATTYTETGSATAPMTASGADIFTTTDTGSGISAHVGSGAKVREKIKTGSGVAPLTASGADVLTATKTGSGISAGEGSGAKIHELAPDTGAGVASMVASGVKVLEKAAKTGSAISAYVGSGADVFTATETGSGVASLVGSGSKSIERQDTGSGIAPLVGSGVKVHEPTKTGAGVAPLTASGADQLTASRTGAGVASGVGSGTYVVENVKTGSATAPLTASGADTVTTSRTGAGVLQNSIGSGVEVVDSGGATISKTGLAASAYVGSGADQLTTARTGSGISTHVGSGAYVVENIKTGSATSSHIGSGADQVTSSRTGNGIAPFTASGADIVTSSRTGQGTETSVGSGADQVTSARTGSGISAEVGSGSKSIERQDTGSGISAHVGSGSRIREVTKSGSAISAYAGSGDKIREATRTGIGILEGVGSGFKSATLDKEGAGVATLAASGFIDKSTDKAGTAVSAYSGSGLKVHQPTKTGGAILGFNADGDSRVIYDRTGTGSQGGDEADADDDIIFIKGHARVHVGQGIFV